jgi:hypothetical protein
LSCCLGKEVNNNVDGVVFLFTATLVSTPADRKPPMVESGFCLSLKEGAPMKLNKTLKPQAKMDNLVVQDLSNEILIYNLKNNKAYSLNETTTLVWQNCDGTKDVSEIANSLTKKLNQTVPDELVWLAIDNLKKENLVSFDEDIPALSGINRREVIKRVGLATMVALPMIVAVSAPMAAHAQSGSIQACLDCTVAIGVGQAYTCPSNCGSLNCICFGNNSCMGVGQTAGATGDCMDCEIVGASDMNNSFRCT